MIETGAAEAATKEGAATAEAAPKPSWIDWTVEVEDFGPIKQASITMAPLVILVGKNNTGKSYMATLLWALLNPAELFPFNAEVSPNDVPEWFQEAVRLSGQEQNNVPANADDLSLDAWQALNAWLANRKDQILSSLFWSSQVKAAKIVVHPKSIAMTRLGAPQSPGAKGLAITMYVDQSGRSFLTFDVGRANPAQKQSIIQQWTPFAQAIYRYLMVGALPIGNSHVPYLPAARTGLMLAYKALVAGLLENFGFAGQRPPTIQLPLPVIRMLQSLTVGQRRYSSPPLDAIAETLERKVLGGTIVSSTGPIPDHTFRPDGQSTELPLHVASSLVTELAPFIILLKTSEGLDALVFEEPEAHLHLEAQRHLARAIVSLVNAGVAVVLTTHSDTFLQEINTLIAVSSSSQKTELMRKFGLQDSECLNPDHVRLYEFVDAGSGTIVKPAPRGDFGFIIESINGTLRQMAQDSYAIPSPDGDED